MADVGFVGALCSHCGHNLGSSRLCPGCKAYTAATMQTPATSSSSPPGGHGASSPGSTTAVGRDVHGCLVLEAKGFEGLNGAIAALALIERASEVPSLIEGLGVTADTAPDATTDTAGDNTGGDDGGPGARGGTPGDGHGHEIPEGSSPGVRAPAPRWASPLSVILICDL